MIPSSQRSATYRAKQAARVKAMEGVITEANNSLYGSQGMFMATNGGAPDKYHLARPIEDLKWQSNAEWRRAERYKAALTRIAEAPAWGAPHRWEEPPHEVRQLARAALAPQGEK